MADKNLILGARLAAGGFNTGLADVVDKSIARATKNITGIFEAQAEYAAEIDRRAFDIINQFPPDINFSKLDPQHVEALQAWSTAKKEDYFKKAQQLAKTRVNSPEFLTLQTELNQIKQAYVNANDNLINLQAKRTTYTQDRGDELISSGMHKEDINLEALDKLLLPDGLEYKVAYDDFGNPTYTVGDKKITMKDLDWYSIDNKFAQFAGEQSVKVQNAGIKGLELKPGTAMYDQLMLSLDSQLRGQERFKSILNDKMFNDVGLDFTPDQIAKFSKDPAGAKEAIKQKMMSHYMNINGAAYKSYINTLNAQNNNNNSYSAGDQFDLDAAAGTVKDAITFINSRPDVNAIKRVIGQTDLEGSAKYATGAEIIKRFGEDKAAGVGVTKEDNNKLYYAAVDGQGGTQYRVVPLDQNDQGALFDFYMNAYNISPEVSAIYKSRLNLGTFTPVNNNTNPLANPINLSDGDLQKINDYINEMGISLNNVNRTGTPKSDEELITEF